MPLIKNNQLVDDPWRDLSDENKAPLAEETDIIVSYERWREDRNVLVRRNGRLGVKLSSDQPPSLIEDSLEYLDVIVLDFPRFTDGRGFSYARLLRERYGFTGEIRAVGQWFRDQMAFMQRCGINAFVVNGDRSLGEWLEAQQEISVVYQPAADDRTWVSRMRSTASRTARAAAE